MATSLKGRFQNNRRREVNAVTATFPFVLQDADVRTATAEVKMTSGEYIGLTLPANCIVTGVHLVVTDVFNGAGSTAAVEIGGTAAIAATSVTAEGITTSASVPMLLTSASDVKVTMVIAGSGTKGECQVVIDYIDYTCATMDYIGAE